MADSPVTPYMHVVDFLQEMVELLLGTQAKGETLEDAIREVRWLQDAARQVPSGGPDNAASGSGPAAVAPLDDESLAEALYSHSHFHDLEPNPTADLMRDGAERIRSLARSEKEPTDFGLPNTTECELCGCWSRATGCCKRSDDKRGETIRDLAEGILEGDDNHTAARLVAKAYLAPSAIRPCAHTWVKVVYGEGSITGTAWPGESIYFIDGDRQRWRYDLPALPDSAGTQNG